MRLSGHEQRRRHLLRMAGARDEKVYIGPEHVYIPVTTRCNLRCAYCFYHSPGNPKHFLPSQDMPVKTFQALVRGLVDLEVDAVYISGEGEPVLHPDFSGLMAFLQQQPVAVTLFTNGTFSGKSFADLVKADCIIVNFGAVTRSGYWRLQGEDLFDAVIRNIRRLVRFRDRYKPDLDIEVNYVVTRLNAADVGTAEKILKKAGVNTFSPSFMREDDGNIGVQAVAVKDVLKGFVRPSPFCFNGWFFAIVDVLGCPRLCYQRPRAPGPEDKARSFRDAWYSKEFMEERLEGKRGALASVVPGCRKCFFHDRNQRVIQCLSGAAQAFHDGVQE